MKHERVLTDVPERDLKPLEDDFKSDGAEKVIKVKQPDGLWTIRVVLDDKAAE